MSLATLYVGMAPAIANQRERIKRRTIEYRRLQHRKLVMRAATQDHAALHVGMAASYYVSPRAFGVRLREIETRAERVLDMGHLPLFARGFSRRPWISAPLIDRVLRNGSRCAKSMCRSSRDGVPPGGNAGNSSPNISATRP